MGIFPSMLEIDILLPLRFQSSFTCLNCSSLESMGSFPSLTGILFNQFSINPMDISPTFTCQDCPNLNTMGSFPILEELDSAFFGVIFAPEYSCKSCPALSALDNFPLLSHLGGPKEIIFTPKVSCQDCDALTSMGQFFLSSLNSITAKLQPTFQCSGCPSLITMGSFPNVSNIEASSSSEATISNFSPSISCFGCPALSLLGGFDSLSRLTSHSPTSTPPPSITFTPTLACTSCPTLASLGLFSSLNELDSPLVLVSPNVTCVDCHSLVTLGSFPSLSHISVTSPESCSAKLSPSLSCQGCPNLAQLSSFPLLEEVKCRSTSSLSTVDAEAVFEPSVLCASCGSLSLVGNFPSFLGVLLDAGPKVNSLISFRPSFSCSGCSSLVLLVDFTQLAELGNEEALKEASFYCLECSSLSSFLPQIPPAQLDPNSLSSAFSYICSQCTSLLLATAGIYTFEGTFPAITVAPEVIVGFSFRDIQGETFATFPLSITRVSSLSFRNISTIVNLDFLYRLEVVEEFVSLTTCPNLEEIDGLRVSLQRIRSFEAKDNPRLCSQRLGWISSIVERQPILQSNGANRTSAECGVELEPVPLGSINATLFGTKVQLSWNNPTQPSSFVLYQLLLDTLPILSFYSAEDVTSYVTGDLTKGTTYSIQMAVFYGSRRAYSSQVTITIPSDASSCAPGYILNQANLCEICSKGTFQKGNLCLSCPTGTFLPSQGAFSASDCQPCPQGTFADTIGSEECSPCPQDCPRGSSLPLQTLPGSEGYTVEVRDKNGNLLTEQNEFPFHYPYLGIFLGGVLISGLIIIPLRKRLRSYISPISVVLRTPSYVLRVIPNSWTLKEIPSLYRGLIGIWVLFGSLMITLYQVHLLVASGRSTLTSVQPGTTFKSGESTSTTTTSFFLNVSLHNTPITCDPSKYSMAFQGQSIPNSFSASLSCFERPDGSLELSYPSSSFSFGPDSRIVVSIDSLEGTPVFFGGLGYQIEASSFEERTIKMRELISDPPLVNTG